MLGFSPIGALPIGASSNAGPIAFALAGAAGSFALTGHAAQTSTGRATPGASGSFSLTGSASVFRIAHGLPGRTGVFSLTGSAANLDAPTRHLDGATGSFALTGSRAQTATGKRTPGQAGHFTLTGAGISATERQAPSQTGQFRVTGSSATLGGLRRPTTPVALLLAAAIEGNAPCIGIYTVPERDIFDLGYEGVISLGISMVATATATP